MDRINSLVIVLLLLFTTISFSCAAPCAPCMKEQLLSESAPNNEPNFRFIFPISNEEALESSGQIAGLFIIFTLMVSGAYSDNMLDQIQARTLIAQFYAGLLLHSTLNKVLMIPYITLHKTLELTDQGFENNDIYSTHQNTLFQSNTATGYARPTNQPPLSLYMTKSVSEPLLLPQYVSELFHKNASTGSCNASADQLATLTTINRRDEYYELELSITHPDNSSHDYRIAHEDGCNWLLGYDGLDITSQATVTWFHESPQVITSDASTHPAPKQGQLIVEVPRELIMPGINELTSSYLARLFTLLPLSVDLQGFPNEHQLATYQPESSLTTSGLNIKNLLSYTSPGIIRLMEKGTEQTTYSFSQSPSFSTSSFSDSPSPDGKKISPSDRGSSDGNNKKPPSSSGKESPVAVLSASLLEEVATEKLRLLRAENSSTNASKINVKFIHLLSEAGLAQAVLPDKKSDIPPPLVISQTLVKYLISDARATNQKRAARIKGLMTKDRYYLELGQDLFDEIVEQFASVQELAVQRVSVFESFHQALRQASESSGKHFVLIGGEAIRQTVRENNRHYLRNNYVVTDDIDLLFDINSFESFLKFMPEDIAGYKMETSRKSNILFSIPVKEKLEPFSSYKIHLKSHWGDLLPSMDISFPLSEEVSLSRDDKQPVFYQSMHRSFLFKHNQQYDRQKYLDRVILLKALQPQDAHISHLYNDAVVLPAQSAEIDRLSEKASQLKAKKKNINSELESKTQTIKRLQALVQKNNKLQQNNYSLQTQLEEVTDVLSTTQQQLIEARSETENLKDSLAASGKQLSETKSETDTLKKSLASSTKQYAKLSEEYAALQKELKKLRSILTVQPDSQASKTKAVFTVAVIDAILDAGRSLGKNRQRTGIAGITITMIGIASAYKLLAPSGKKKTASAPTNVPMFSNPILRNIPINMPLNTKIPVFPEVEEFSPGNLPVRDTDNPEDYTQSFDLAWKVFYDQDISDGMHPVMTNKMNLLTPKRLKPLGRLTEEDYNQLETAIIKYLRPTDTEKFIADFARANLLLCGLMPDQAKQTRCSYALSRSIREKGWWPCDEKDYVPTKSIARFERYVVPSLTTDTTGKALLGLIPSWRVTDNGAIKWYALWPKNLKNNSISDLDFIETCAKRFDSQPACENNASFIKEFVRNNWVGTLVDCSHTTTNSVYTESELIWIQTSSGSTNIFFACHKGKLIETSW